MAFGSLELPGLSGRFGLFGLSMTGGIYAGGRVDATRRSGPRPQRRCRIRLIGWAAGSAQGVRKDRRCSTRETDGVSYRHLGWTRVIGPSPTIRRDSALLWVPASGIGTRRSNELKRLRLWQGNFSAAAPLLLGTTFATGHRMLSRGVPDSPGSAFQRSELRTSAFAEALSSDPRDAAYSSYSSGAMAPSAETRVEGLRSERRPPVLIVEDDRISRRILAQLLRTCGYETQTAETGEEALRLLRDGRDANAGDAHAGDANAPGIALVDLNLPGIDGIELIRRLSDLAPSLVPILVTATGEESLHKALSRRPVLYLRKPIDFKRLMVLLSELPTPSSNDRPPGGSDGYGNGRGGERLMH